MARDTAPKLKDEHRAFLVQQMACFSSPLEASEALKETYGVQISPPGAMHYDPTKKSGGSLAKRWVEMFWRIREEFLEHISKQVPEAHKAVRVNELAKAARHFKRVKNYVAMADMFERIAKELGNVHTNRHEHTGKGGGPIRYSPVEDMTDDELHVELLKLLGREQLSAEEPTTH